MERTLVAFMVISLFGTGTYSYTCPKQEYADKAEAWWEMMAPFCGSFTPNNSQKLMKCIEDRNIKFMESVNSCQDKLEMPISPSYYQYITKACNDKTMGSKEFICCVTDTIIKSGATDENINRASIYSICLIENVKHIP